MPFPSRPRCMRSCTRWRRTGFRPARGLCPWGRPTASACWPCSSRPSSQPDNGRWMLRSTISAARPSAPISPACGTRASIRDCSGHEPRGVFQTSTRRPGEVRSSCASRVLLPLSPCGLRRAHISESPTLSHLFEAMPTTAHGDRPRWTLGSVTGPATEPRDNPGEPGDRLPGMRVLLFGGVAFETSLQGLEHRQLFLRDHVGGRAIDGAVSGEDQLHDLGGGDHCDGGELEQGFGRFDLAALDVETLALAGAEQLFDVPALAIPADDLQCLRNRRNLMSGKETPMDRLLDGGIKLPDLDQAQGQLTRGRGIAAVARALDRHFSKAQRYLGRTSRTAGLGSDLQLEAMPDRPAFGNAKQPAATHQCAIATGAGEQMGARVGYPVKFFVDIALAVADYCGPSPPRQARSWRSPPP